MTTLTTTNFSLTHLEKISLRSKFLIFFCFHCKARPLIRAGGEMQPHLP